MFVSNFKHVLPTYLREQNDGLDWLAKAHARHSTDVSSETFFKLLQRFGCGSDKIQQRYTFLRDFTHQNWDQMQIMKDVPANVDARMAFFNEVLLPSIGELYPEEKPDFSTWIHVSCTGYVSPSIVQTLISRKGWGKRVEALHAYHMGCYAAFPALRMARGNSPTEILHTELCTLHLDPTSHLPEQLVIQSLFADGVIRYRVTEEKPALGYEIVELKEVIADDSLRHMTWDVSSVNFKMTLAREVPNAVQNKIGDVVKSWQTPQSVYAIHPGGPRIIDAVKEALGLSEEQVHFSREILKMHGNMSSATLPHVWEKMLTEIPNGTPVISMAFGPGLTLSTGLMKKVGV